MISARSGHIAHQAPMTPNRRAFHTGTKDSNMANSAKISRGLGRQEFIVSEVTITVTWLLTRMTPLPE
jgi:hypothetical protein